MILHTIMMLYIGCAGCWQGPSDELFKRVICRLQADLELFAPVFLASVPVQKLLVLQVVAMGAIVDHVAKIRRGLFTFPLPVTLDVFQAVEHFLVTPTFLTVSTLSTSSHVAGGCNVENAGNVCGASVLALRRSMGGCLECWGCLRWVLSGL